jgi:hypothetical protein
MPSRKRKRLAVGAFNVKFGKAVVTACTVLGGLGVAGPARATLGGDVASVAANQQRLGGAHEVHGLASGERHDLELPSGIVVHEYVSASGAVYAIAWRGPRMPDLRELMGPYFAQLTHQDSHFQGGHHRMRIVGADLVIQSSGHRRSFEGRAWVPSLVPAGINVETSVE